MCQCEKKLNVTKNNSNMANGKKIDIVIGHGVLGYCVTYKMCHVIGEAMSSNLQVQLAGDGYWKKKEIYMIPITETKKG